MEIQNIEIEKLLEPREDIRSIIIRENLDELKESIKDVGILNPLTVVPRGDKFEIVSGHRRYLAAKELGLEKVPCIVREIDDAQILAERIHENIKREELNIVDQAELIRKLHDREGWTYERIGRLFGKSEAWAREVERVGYCSDFIKDALLAGHIKKSHALILMKHPDPERRRYFLKLCIENGASPRTLDLWVRDDIGTIQYTKEVKPVQKYEEAHPRVTNIKAPCAICDDMYSPDALYVLHVCEKCYNFLMEQKGAK